MQKKKDLPGFLGQGPTRQLHPQFCRGPQPSSWHKLMIYSSFICINYIFSNFQKQTTHKKTQQNKVNTIKNTFLNLSLSLDQLKEPTDSNRISFFQGGIPQIDINIQLMSLKKTETVQLDEPQSWGTLVPLVNSQPLPTYTLSQSQILVGRNPECLICINDKRLSGKHCTFSRSGNRFTLTDLSTNGTFIADKKVGKGNTVELSHLNQIWLLTASKVPVAETIGFRLELTGAKKEQANRKIVQEQESKKKSEDTKKREEEEQRKKQQQQIKAKQKEQANRKQAQEKKKKEQSSSTLAKSIKQQITCSFCYQIMSIPVAIQPCNHRFCGGCLTELVNNKKDTCIQCRKQITTAMRDAAFTSIIDDYLKSHPDQKRDPKEQQDLKAKNIFTFDALNVKQRIHGKVVEKKKAEKAPPARRGRGRALVRASSDLSASDDDERDKCRECVVARDGFQCSATQVHIGCHTCGKLIAQRDDPALDQCCAICTTYFCNLYFPPCKAGSKLLKLTDRRQSCKIDPALMRGNETQFEIIRNFLLSKKKNSRDLFDEVLQLMDRNKFTYIMDRKIMRAPPLVSKEVKLKKQSPVCDLCWNDLWFQMVFAYRTDITPQLPSSARDRPACYWGINCRTMDHNKDHAKKYNHLLYQTRFS